MFTTYRGAEIHLDPVAESTGTQLWSHVEQELAWPWFYLQIVRRHGRKAYRSMLMVLHAHDLRKIVDDQSNLAWVEQVQLVTPPHLNGQPRWLMEPVEEVCVVRDGPDGNPGYLYKVANGVSAIQCIAQTTESRWSKPTWSFQLNYTFGTTDKVHK